GENIASLSAGYSIGDIRRAAKISSVDGSIEGFEEGYDTIVGERGVTLSGGQKQRIAIARTILKNPPIMIFDDSLSAVDTQTDANIRASLGELTAGVTTLLIAYRITSLSRADHIIVLDAGKIVEAGSHEELLAMGGVYKRVHDMQESIADLDETQSDCESLGG
ncbi:MAG: ATP-binding cassette domain-containing protein, partial [Oscillospiraceae bacterium]|nr:ATP-binding cassette domain-containing protein [Oscillospiraceae bacterium]